MVAIVMIFAVVIQNSKGGGLSSAFGTSGATQILGARRSNEAIEKLTWGLAIGLAVLAFIANVAGNYGTSGSGDQLRMGSAIENQIVNDPVSMPDASSFDIAPAEDENATGDN
ncbi:MAG: preprotein translocase subunit SecG [Bacteroidia bacterium]